MKLDELDDRLLSAFAGAFPRPNEIPFCDQDVLPADMVELCTGVDQHENIDLIPTFVSHNRLGMFGDWTQFPAFAGEAAVIARRDSFTLEFDLLFLYLHTSVCGYFDDSLSSLLVEWVEDILMPWNRIIERKDLFWWEIHAIGYLGIYRNAGGDPTHIIQENIARSRSISSPTPLLKIIHDHYLTNLVPIFHHFYEAQNSADNQELPEIEGNQFVAESHVKQICEAIETVRFDIKELFLDLNLT